jgi:hypothetical protein
LAFPHVLSVPELGKVSEETVALWLLSLICSYHGRSKYTVMELNGIDIVFDRLASSMALIQIKACQHLPCSVLNEDYENIVLLRQLYRQTTASD